MNMTQRVYHAVVGDGRLGANSVGPICITGSLGDISKFDIIQAVSVFQIVHLDMKVDSSSLGVRVLFPGLSLSAEVAPCVCLCGEPRGKGRDFHLDYHYVQLKGLYVEDNSL